MAPRSFKKFAIAVSGTIPGYKQADVKALVEGQGGTFITAVNDDCTHLITTQKDTEKNSVKYQSATKIKGCKIVTVDWLVECNNASKVVPEKSYLISAMAKDDSQKKQKPAKDASPATGNKRAIKDESEEEDSQPTKKQKDAKKASPNGTLNVPVDEVFNHPTIFRSGAPKVFIEDNGMIWDATLNQTDSHKNNNKFYRVQVIVSNDESEYVTWTRWGRVGEFGQSAALGNGTLDEAKKFFERKFKDKSGLKWENRLDPPKAGKYMFIERDYEADDTEDEQPVTKKEKDEPDAEVESELTKPLQNLMSFIFNFDHFQSAMASMSYDAKKLPLGKLSERTLKMGFTTLKELAALITSTVHDSDWKTSVDTLSNQYFTIIPHVFGRNRPPILNTDALIKKEIDLLEALTDMDVANEIMKESKLAEIHQLDRQFQSLGMKEMTRLEQSSTEFLELANYLNSSRGATHHINYTVIDIFRVEREGEEARFQSSPYAKIQNSDRRLLWHGSRSTNFGGILSQGLRIAPPEAPVNGYMFGKGVYLADTSTKSANYCCPYNSAGMGLLLLCDAELGDPMLELTNSDYQAGENAKAQGKIATLGKGCAVPGGWKNASVLNSALDGVKMPDITLGQAQNNNAGLQYNEYIVYDVAQIRQRYLFYVRMH
ncbi:hypothetical protein N7478_000185 [Penicillium angulare]|uniref:uncharacterized protein n=1 Tax=Penicillium angulare TaxID=116970 RepID=UPI00253FEB94|nr:uncharacterized protein N7478_000185 [Penicillium angulare]KAJ5290934.1 hypothetical protein N7478_000185 [Penicillium angulare]